MAISLKAARVNRNLSQKTVSEMLGVSAATVCRWEKGIVPLKETDLEQLISLYGVSVNDVEVPKKREEDGSGQELA